MIANNKIRIMTKKVLLELILIITTMCFAGCGAIEEEEIIIQEDSITITPGVLTVGAHIGYAPMEYYNEDNDVEGFDIDLAKALAEEMDMEVEITPCAWDAIFKNVDLGTFDVIISGVSYTKERDEKYSLTDSYLNNGLVLVVPNQSKLSLIDDFSGEYVGVQIDTTADYAMQDFAKNGKNLEVAQYENVINAFEAMERGEIAGVCADSVVANYYIMNNKDNMIIWESTETEPLCICLTKDNSELRDEVNNALNRLKENGTLKEISIKYFGTDLTIN